LAIGALTKTSLEGESSMTSTFVRRGAAGLLCALGLLACSAAPDAREATERTDDVVDALSEEQVTANDTVGPIEYSELAVVRGRTVSIHDAKDFCLLLPRPHESVADGESDATAYCTKPQKDAPGAHTLAAGGLKSVHLKSTPKHWVQVTGKLVPSKLGLSSKDEGGQYDNHGKGSPAGATCAGWPHFVELVEPAESRYCIRCCESTSDCPTGRSTAGCPALIPGNYN
jgi:hypothetical protein